MAAIVAIVMAVVAVACMGGFYLSWRATRLDRLHARVETATAALDAALLRRCAAAKELATSGLLDPAAGLLLANAEQEARVTTDRDRRADAETRLSKALEAVCPGVAQGEVPAAGSPKLLEEQESILRDLADATRSVSVARHFHNSTVEATLAARRQPLARLFRLAGTALTPEPFDMEEQLISSPS